MAYIQQIPVEKLRPHPHNPRKDLGDLTELAKSIEGNGVLQNLTVVPISCVPDLTGRKFGESSTADEDLYVVVIGHRRLAAATMAGEESVPCVVEIMAPGQQQEIMLIENMQRSDLTYYEQAQGFQMMFDMGHSVKTISNRTGFSETTVRRRLKMAELDPKLMQEISGRQISLDDFDELAKVEDLDERNALLETMGTNDFQYSINQALRKQVAKKFRPLVEAWAKEHKAKAIERSDTWSGKYDQIGPYIRLAKWGEEDNRPPEDLPEKLYYYMDDDNVRLFTKREKTKAEKSPEQLAREKAIADAWQALEDDAASAYELRKGFIDGLIVTNKNKEMLLRGALWAGAYCSLFYHSADSGAIRKEAWVSIEEMPKLADRYAAVAKFLETMDDKKLPVIVYALFGDSARQMCIASSFKGAFPKYEIDTGMNLLYDWLAFLGYEMSSVETSIMNGSHPSFHMEDEDAAE